MTPEMRMIFVPGNIIACSEPDHDTTPTTRLFFPIFHDIGNNVMNPIPNVSQTGDWIRPDDVVFINWVRRIETDLTLEFANAAVIGGVVFKTTGRWDERHRIGDPPQLLEFTVFPMHATSKMFKVIHDVRHAV